MEQAEVNNEKLDKLERKVDAIYKMLASRPLIKETTELLSVKELSMILDISESTIYRAITKGILTKNANGKLHPFEIYEALQKKLLKCDRRYAEEFCQTYIFR